MNSYEGLSYDWIARKTSFGMYMPHYSGTAILQCTCRCDRFMDRPWTQSPGKRAVYNGAKMINLIVLSALFGQNTTHDCMIKRQLRFGKSVNLLNYNGITEVKQRCSLRSTIKRPQGYLLSSLCSSHFRLRTDRLWVIASARVALELKFTF